MNIEQIISAIKNKGYAVFENDTKPYNLNITGVRAKSNIPESFNDLMIVFWKFNGKWEKREFPCTTDPGLYYLKNPLNVHGTGILKEGQYRSAYQLGLHRGKYKALTQVKPLVVIRDFDRDGELDFVQPDFSKCIKKEKTDSEETIMQWYFGNELVYTETTGYYGINIHRANAKGTSTIVGKWSAACQVLQNRNIFHPDNQSVRIYEYDYFIHLCEKSAGIYGNKFTYTLLNEKDF